MPRATVVSHDGLPAKHYAHDMLMDTHPDILVALVLHGRMPPLAQACFALLDELVGSERDYGKAGALL